MDTICRAQGLWVALNWLHLSDFHIPAYDSYDRDVVLRALVGSVARFRDEGRQPSLIFVTGDVGASGRPGEYELATKLFDDLLDAAGLERRHLFVIPGNHDVDRDRGVGLARSLASREEADSYFSPSSAMPHMSLKLAAFRQWYTHYFAGVRDCSDSSCGPVEEVEVDGVRIGVLPLNSALFCQDDNDHAKLWIGRRALDVALGRLTEIDVDVRIALIHHPLDWLADGERANVRAMLAGNVDFLLRGHLHDTEIEQVVSWHGAMTSMAAGAAYQTRRWPNRALYVTLGDSSLTVFPIRYEDSPEEIWTVDPSVFPESQDHIGTFDPAFPEHPVPGQGKVTPPDTRMVPPAPPAFRSNIPSTRGLAVVGRNAELDEMKVEFSNLAEERVLVLTGTPGVGKSELAREFARRNADRYPGGMFLIDATSADIPVDLARVGATYLGIEFPDGLPLDGQCERALIALGSAPTLLIYDNVHSFSSIEKWLPPAGMACHVVITTVHEPVAPGWRTLNLNPLSEEQSEELILNLAGPIVAKKHGSALASHAGGLPVQLCPVASVLAYEERRGRAAEQHLSSLAGETQESFSLVYELLDEPVRLLLHAALGLNPQRINQGELAKQLEIGTGWTEADFNAALDACRDVHLLEGDDPIRMHQLLASFLESIAPANGFAAALLRLREVQVQRLATIAAALHGDLADGQLATDLLGFRLAPDEWDSMGAPIPPECCPLLAAVLLDIGEFEKAHPWCERAVEECRRGDENGEVNHQALGGSLHQVGFFHSSVGEFEKALSSFEQAVEEKRQGDLQARVNHESLGSSLHQVGVCLSHTGKFEQARPWFEDAVEECRLGDVNGGVDHESIGSSLHQVGICHVNSGDFEQARPWFEKAVEESRLGDVDGGVDRQSLGRSLHQVGFCYSSVGEFEKARSFYEESAEEKRHGDRHGRIDHQSLGASLNQVGTCYSDGGDFDKAIPWFEAAAEEKRHGDRHGRIDHQSLGGSLHEVGFCYSSSGEFEKARSFYERAVEEKRQGEIHGRIDHESVSTSLHQVGICQESGGNFEQARLWFERAVEESRLGDIHGRVDHESVGRSTLEVGFCHSRLGDLEQARPWLESAVEEFRQGDMHGHVVGASVAISLRAVAKCLRGLGELERAAEREAEARALDQAD